MRAPTTSIPTTRMTAEEFLEWGSRPENENRCFELVRGEVVELSVPTKIHGRVCMRIGFILETYVVQRGFGYTTSNDAGVILERDPDTVRGPDVALYEDANSFEELHPKYGEVPPRLAVEVLSPNDAYKKVFSKVMNYLRCGVPLVWVVDFEDRTVVVHRPNAAPVEFNDTQELTGEDILPGLRFKVSDLFFVPQAAPPANPAPPAPSPG